MNLTRIFLLFLLFTGSWTLTFSQSKGFAYQAVARDAAGSPLANQSVLVRALFRAGGPAGAAAYEETHSLTTNDFGLLSAVLGQGTVVSGSFDALDWSATEYNLEIQVNGFTVSNELMQAVPFSKIATDMGLSDLADVNDAGPVNGQVLKYNGTEWAPAGDATATYTAGAGIAITGNSIASTLGTSIEFGEISAGAVISEKIANNAVTTDKIANGAVTVAKLNQSGAANGQVLKWNGSAWAPAADNGGSASQWTTVGANIHYSSGNVGVGDASPASTFTVGNGDKFQVAGTDGDLLLTDPQGTIRFPALTAPGAAPMIQMFTAGTQNATRMVISHSPSFPNWGMEYKDTTDVVYFRDSGSRKFAFELGSGHMGIGIEDPAFPLDINGRMRLRSTGNLSNSPGIWFQNNASTFDRAFFGMSEPDSLIGIFSQHLGKWAIEFEVMREPRIGINIPAGSPPRAEIHLYHTNFGGSNDGVRIQNEGSNAHYWNLYTSNTTGDFEFFKSGIKRATINQTSGAYTAVSDARLKKNVSPLGAVMPMVLALQPKTYQYNDVEDERYFTGFLAQELNEQFPQFVYYGGDDQKYFTVDYAGLSVIALKAIQEQQAQITTLGAGLEAERQRNEVLKEALEAEKQRNDALEARLRRLEEMMIRD